MAPSEGSVVSEGSSPDLRLFARNLACCAVVDFCLVALVDFWGPPIDAAAANSVLAGTIEAAIRGPLLFLELFLSASNEAVYKIVT
jgi:hypothetical protein